MPSWSHVKSQEPEFAERVEHLFQVGRHKTIATLRADGSPRISGIECDFVDGELTFASMSDARKLGDLRRDARFSLHGPSIDPEVGREAAWPGEAKISGIAVPVVTPGPSVDGASDAQGFVADIREVVVTHLNTDATKLVVEWWTPEGGRQRAERD